MKVILPSIQNIIYRLVTWVEQIAIGNISNKLGTRYNIPIQNICSSFTNYFETLTVKLYNIMLFLETIIELKSKRKKGHLRILK